MIRPPPYPRPRQHARKGEIAGLIVCAIVLVILLGLIAVLSWLFGAKIVLGIVVGVGITLLVFGVSGWKR